MIVSIGQHAMANKIVVKASFPSVEKMPMDEEVEKDTIEPVVADEPCKSGEITTSCCHMMLINVYI